MERFRDVSPRPARHARSRRSRGPQEVVVKASLEKPAPAGSECAGSHGAWPYVSDLGCSAQARYITVEAPSGAALLTLLEATPRSSARPPHRCSARAGAKGSGRGDRTAGRDPGRVLDVTRSHPWTG
jgi:hypothetical protein